MARVYMQMAQLGLLTSSEVFEAVKSGILPDKETSILNQKEYIKQRDGGLFAPLVGGDKQQETGRPDGTSSPQTTKKVTPIGKAKGAYKFSTMKLGDLTLKANSLKESVIASLKKKYKMKKDSVLNDGQLFIVDTLTKNIISNESPDNWSESISSYLANPKEVSKEVADEIDEISIQFDTSSFEASILRHAKL